MEIDQVMASAAWNLYFEGEALVRGDVRFG